MKKKVALLLVDGFEEAEAIVIMDVLRRLQIQVDLLACQPSTSVVGYWGLPVTADALLMDRFNTLYDAVILPGGLKGSRNLGSNKDVIEFITKHQIADQLVCSICSAGAHVLAANKLLHGRSYVCSAENYKLYSDGSYIDKPVVEDGNIMTGKGLGYAFEFAFSVGARLVGADVAHYQADHIYFHNWQPEIVYSAPQAV